jgi:glycosyltransferase involved in cell wall biosynthesis
MRILILHNRYQQAGGEDAVVASECAMLQEHGHAVRLLEANNDGIRGLGSKLRTSLECLYSHSSRRLVEAELRAFRPEIVHAHNLFPVLTPSVLYACAEAGVPCVQTLHNYRWLCPGAILYREGATCEQCLTKRAAYPAVLHGCYRGSRMGTLPVAALAAIHLRTGLLERNVARFIVLSEFARGKFIEGGLASEKVCVKPNFLDRDPGVGAGAGGYVLYVGRLTEEKGIGVLLSTWRKLGRRIPLKIAGAGPMAEECRRAAEENFAIEYLGPRSPQEIFDLMGDAVALVFPSRCYETFGRAMIESFAKGTPVIASKLGAMAELVEHGRTGLHFASGDGVELAAQVEWMLAHPAEWNEIRRAAREKFESKYTAGRNHSMLMEIYEQVIAGRSDYGGYCVYHDDGDSGFKKETSA